MKSNLPTLAAVFVLALASPARAAGPADSSNATEKARAVFHQGVQLYNEGSFEGALAEFRKAYELSPNYRLLYNIAQTYFDLHDYVSSWRTLKQYAQEGGNELSATRRAEVSELNQKLEDRIAYLEIGCNLEGADIRVDDMSVGSSPLTSSIMVNAGPRRVAAIKPGYAVTARMVTVGGREVAKVALEMVTLAQSPADGLVTLKGMPPSFLEVESARKPRRVGLITSTVVTAGFAIATGVFGVFALKAKDDFDHELDKIPNTKDGIDSARTRVKHLAYATDALGAATLVSGGVALYFLLADSGAPKSPAKTTVAVAPTVGGLSLHGEW